MIIPCPCSVESCALGASETWSCWAGLDYLYWRADRLEQYMPVQNDVITYFPPQYSSGFRAGLGIEHSFWNLGARYTYFNSNQTQKKLGTNNFLYTLQYHLNYQTVDLNIGCSWLLLCQRCKISPYVGAKLAWLQETTDLVQSNTSKTKKYHSNAYGPSLGMHTSYQVWSRCLPVSLLGSCEIAILSVKSTFAEPFLQTSDPVNNPLEVRDPAYYFTSVQTLFLGLGFDLCNIACIKGRLEVGYEIQNWTSLYTYVGVGHQEGHLDSLGLGGLTLRFISRY